MQPSPDNKPALRKYLAKCRDDLGAAFRETASREIADNIVDWFADQDIMSAGTARVVSGFYPFNSEIDCLALMAALNKAGCVTVLPFIIAPHQPLGFRQWGPGDPTIPGIWDIPVPLSEAANLVPDILLVPLLGFDRAGYRIGYGGGFYDRTLARLGANGKIISVGLAFSTQEVDEVPREAHDVPLDWILTENGLFRAGEQVS